MTCACINQDKHSICRSPCRFLERELAKVEVDRRDILMSPEEIERQLNARLSFVDEPDPFRAALLSEAIDKLSPMQRTCMGLYAHGGMSPTTIARTLELSRSAVRIHLRRAAVRLFGALGESVPASLTDLRPRPTGLFIGEVHSTLRKPSPRRSPAESHQLDDMKGDSRHAELPAHAS